MIEDLLKQGADIDMWRGRSVDVSDRCSDDRFFLYGLVQRVAYGYRARPERHG